MFAVTRVRYKHSLLYNEYWVSIPYGVYLLYKILFFWDEWYVHRQTSSLNKTRNVLHVCPLMHTRQSTKTIKSINIRVLVNRIKSIEYKKELGFSLTVKCTHSSSLVYLHFNQRSFTHYSSLVTEHRSYIKTICLETVNCIYTFYLTQIPAESRTRTPASQWYIYIYIYWLKRFPSKDESIVFEAKAV